jgi:cell division protein FtsB
VRRPALLLAGLALLVALGFLSSVVTQGFSELDQARQERRRLQDEKARLEAGIAELEMTLQALHRDPAAVESLARRDLGWVRPGERVILLATPTPPPQPSLTDPEPTPILSPRGGAVR